MSPNNRSLSDYDCFDDRTFGYDEADDAIDLFLEQRNDARRERERQEYEMRERERREYEQHEREYERGGHERGRYSSDLNERLDYYARSNQRPKTDDEIDAERRARAARRLLAEERSTEPPRRAPRRGRVSIPPFPTASAPKNGGEASRSSKADSFSIKRIAGSLIVLAICLIAAYYGLIMTLTGGINRVQVDTTCIAAPAESVADMAVVTSTPTVKNVLLIGIDDDGSSGSRSDTIMIASIDTSTHTVRLCSILRDNYVSIPGHDPSRINSAYAYGGAELLMQTIERNFRIDINDYVSVDMEAMISVIDAIGGVTINISEKEAYQINRYSYSKSPDVSAGEQRLDGRQAVEYARIRKIDSDFGRTNRQRTLLSAIMKECRELSPFKLFSLISTVSPYLTTNMSSAEIASLGLKVVPAMGNEIEQLSIPIDGAYESEIKRDMAVLIPNLPKNAAALREFLYGAEE